MKTGTCKRPPEPVGASVRTFLTALYGLANLKGSDHRAQSAKTFAPEIDMFMEVAAIVKEWDTVVTDVWKAGEFVIQEWCNRRGPGKLAVVLRRNEKDTELRGHGNHTFFPVAYMCVSEGVALTTAVTALQDRLGAFSVPDPKREPLLAAA